MMNLFFYPSAIGQIGIAENGQAITRVIFPDEPVPSEAAITETALLREAGRQLTAYFSGTLKNFDLPLAPQGTVFMKLVWNSLMQIPYGETRSYRDIAENIGNPQACRAVGQANHKNPIPIIIPCHRVIGTNGKLVGYGGGLSIKTYLLELEKKYK